MRKLYFGRITYSNYLRALQVNRLKECTRLLRAWTSKSALRDIALKCIMIMPHLLLQKPCKESKAKDHSEALKRRMAFWQRGDLDSIFRECETIQKRMKKSAPSNSIEAISKKFATLMKKGNVSAAVELLTNSMEGGILPLTDETMQLLQSKHPAAKECLPEAVIDMQVPHVHLPMKPCGFYNHNIQTQRNAFQKQ